MAKCRTCFHIDIYKPQALNYCWWTKSCITSQCGCCKPRAPTCNVPEGGAGFRTFSFLCFSDCGGPKLNDGEWGQQEGMCKAVQGFVHQLMVQSTVSHSFLPNIKIEHTPRCIMEFWTVTSLCTTDSTDDLILQVVCWHGDFHLTNAEYTHVVDILCWHLTPVFLTNANQLSKPSLLGPTTTGRGSALPIFYRFAKVRPLWHWASWLRP